MYNLNCIGVTSSVVDRGFETIKLVFSASPLSTQHKEISAKTNWLRVGIMCPSVATYIISCMYPWTVVSVKQH